MKTRRLVGIAVTAMMLFMPVWAEDEEREQNSNDDGIHLKGWGLRAGLASDPDQFVFGAHWDLGEIVEHLRLQPNVELGFGDDVYTLFGEFAAHYMFRVQSKFTPYAGAGAVIGLARYDRNNNSDTSVEGGLRILGGLQWPLKNGNPLAVEANIGFGDIHEVQFKVAYTF